MSLIRPATVEWQTMIALAGCYGVWLLSIVSIQYVGWIGILPAVLAVTLHSSLQHEALHGHPSRSSIINELLIFPALGLWFPYRRYRWLHLTHHVDVRLTDPFDDPESWYVTATGWQQRSTLSKFLLQINRTLLGRVVIGPALVWFALWRDESRQILSGSRDVQIAWLLHGAGVLPVVFVLWLASVNVWVYVLFVAYPALSILLVRSFIEHRAAETVTERTAVVEAGWLMRMLFLNNNLHAVHHRDPSLSWYRLPQRWQEQKESVLAANAGYHFPGGYWEVAKEWTLKGREPVVHPFWQSNQR